LPLGKKLLKIKTIYLWYPYNSSSTSSSGRRCKRRRRSAGR